MKDVVEFCQKELSKMPGFASLNDQQKALLVVLAAVSVANITIDWLFSHKDEIKEMLK